VTSTDAGTDDVVEEADAKTAALADGAGDHTHHAVSRSFTSLIHRHGHGHGHKHLHTHSHKLQHSTSGFLSLHTTHQNPLNPSSSLSSSSLLLTHHTTVNTDAEFDISLDSRTIEARRQRREEEKLRHGGLVMVKKAAASVAGALAWDGEHGQGSEGSGSGSGRRGVDEAVLRPIRGRRWSMAASS